MCHGTGQDEYGACPLCGQRRTSWRVILTAQLTIARLVQAETRAEAIAQARAGAGAEMWSHYEVDRVRPEAEPV